MIRKINNHNKNVKLLVRLLVTPLISVFCGLRPHHQPLLELGLEFLPGADVLRHPRLDPERPGQDLDLARTSWNGEIIRHFPLHDSKGSCLSIDAIDAELHKKITISVNFKLFSSAESESWFGIRWFESNPTFVKIGIWFESFFEDSLIDSLVIRPNFYKFGTIWVGFSM